MRRVTVFLWVIFTLFSYKSFSQELRVADVKVQGNKRLKAAFVKKISTLEAGAILDSTVIEKDIKRLKRLPSVSHAYYQVFYSHENQYNVFYNIEENFTLIPSVNVYTTNDNEFAYRVGLYEFNLFGRNIAFGGFYQKDIYSSYGINFRAPNLFGQKVGLALNHQNLITEEPIYLENGVADYKYANKAIEVLGLYAFNFNHRIEAGINFFTEEYEYKSGASSPSVPMALDIKKLMYKGIYEYDNLNYFYQYVSGFKSTFNLQYVRARNDDASDFLIGWNDFFYFKRFGARGNWATRLRLGLSTNDDSPLAPFSVDNNLNIRGVGNTIDRGTGSIVLNTEYRHTLLEKNWFVLQGNAFVDAGSWRTPAGDLSDFADKDNIRIYPGIGIRFMHKKIFNAIFRIDYGVGITKDATHGLVFGIGQYF